MVVITAVVVGGASIFGGSGSVLGTVLGVALLGVISGSLTKKRDFPRISLLCRACSHVQDRPGGLKLAKKGETAEKRAVFTIVGHATNAVGLKCL